MFDINKNYCILRSSIIGIYQMKLTTLVPNVNDFLSKEFRYRHAFGRGFLSFNKGEDQMKLNEAEINPDKPR
jgi:hypothetical protein